MLEKPQHVIVIDLIEEAFDVGLDNPTDFAVRDHFRNPPERVVGAAIRTKPKGAIPKLRLPDRLKNPAKPVLYDPILEAGNAQRATPTIRLRNINPP